MTFSEDFVAKRYDEVLGLLDNQPEDFADRRIEATVSNGERIVASAGANEFVLGGDPAPTKNQVAAVLRALADRALNTRMVGVEKADDLGRYFHYLADEIRATNS